MDATPQGATVSPDGNYWWDTEANEWKPVAGGAADTSGSSSSSDSSATSGDPLDGGGMASCENGAIAGVCAAHDIDSSEIDQVLASAGVTLEA
jgi:hypothetical protein